MSAPESKHTAGAPLNAGEVLTLPLLAPSLVLQMERHPTYDGDDYFVTVRVREYADSFRIFATAFEPVSALILALFGGDTAINVKGTLFYLPHGSDEAVRAAFPELSVQDYRAALAQAVQP